MKIATVKGGANVRSYFSYRAIIPERYFTFFRVAS